MISIRIDVSKIDKTRIVKGDKGQWYDFVLIDTPNGKYGNDYMAVESVTKEEREAGHKGTILGNGKTLVKKAAEPPSSDFDKPALPLDQQGDTDSLPF